MGHLPHDLTLATSYGADSNVDRGEQDMPKVSKDTVTKVEDFGAAIDRSAELDGYAVDFVSIIETHDLAPMLATLSTGRCPCAHWGYVLKGRLTMRYADHEEVVE